MPIRKFHSFEEMNRPIWREPGDPELYRAMARVWELGSKLAARRFPPGVYRYRSIEELDAQCRAWREGSEAPPRSKG